MKGRTSSKSSILISYDDTSNVVIADENGYFTYSYAEPLPIGTKITLIVKEVDGLIYKTKSIQIVYSGELVITSVPDIISFNLKAIKTNPILCPKNNKLVVTVTNSRINSTTWSLYASIDKDLTTDDGNILPNSLVFLDTDNNLNILSSTKTLIYQGEDNKGDTKVTEVVFQEDEGILLQILETLIANSEYKTKINWSIEENT